VGWAKCRSRCAGPPPRLFSLSFAPIAPYKGDSMTHFQTPSQTSHRRRHCHRFDLLSCTFSASFAIRRKLAPEPVAREVAPMRTAPGKDVQLPDSAVFSIASIHVLSRVEPPCSSEDPAPRVTFPAPPYPLPAVTTSGRSVMIPFMSRERK